MVNVQINHFEKIKSICQKCIRHDIFHCMNIFYLLAIVYVETRRKKQRLLTGV